MIMRPVISKSFFAGLAVLAVMALTTSMVHAAASVIPSSTTVSRGDNPVIGADYTFSGIAAPGLTSTAGDYLARGRTIGQNPGVLNVSLTSGAGSVSEFFTVPAATIETALKLNSDRITYRRVFSDVSSGATVTVNMLLLIAGSGQSGPLSLQRAELYFVDNTVRRSEVTVERNATGLKVFAELDLSGSGYVTGYWEVDGQKLENIREYASFGRTLTLSTSDVPGLPTFSTGFHSVQLVITDPAPRFTLPRIAYFVTGVEGRAKLDLTLTTPLQGAQLKPETAFGWQGGTEGSVYIGTIIRSYDDRVVLRGLTRDSEYRIPAGLFAKRLQPHNDYSWHVEAFDDTGASLGKSPSRRVRTP